MSNIDIVTALKLVRQAADSEVREVLDQAITEIEHLRNLSAAGLELAISIVEGQPAETLCLAIIEESQH